MTVQILILYFIYLLVELSHLIFSGHIYSGTADGKVVDIFDGKIRPLAMLGTPPCGIMIFFVGTVFKPCLEKLKKISADIN